MRLINTNPELFELEQRVKYYAKKKQVLFINKMMLLMKKLSHFLVVKCFQIKLEHQMK